MIRLLSKQFYFVTTFLLFIAVLGPVFSGDQHDPAMVMQPLLLAVVINEEDKPNIIYAYLDSNAQLWISQTDLLSWGITSLPKHPLIYRGEQYFQLEWFKGVHYNLDKQALKLNLYLPPSYFPETAIHYSGLQVPAIRPDIPGLFLNYDVIAQHNNFEKQMNYSGFFELGVFNHFGVGTSSFLVQQNNQYSKIVRLETTWTQDQPENIATWRLGDSITSAATWTGAVRFGGIQYATNFNTQPNLVTFPLPSFKGEAVIPSTVDVFVNNVLREREEVQRGAFTLSNIPVVTGSGSITVVTQDILGRQQLLVLPYYASPTLLNPGFSDFSYEAGFIRNDFSIASNHYRDWVASGTYQRGITDNLTLGGHAEFLENQQTLGFSANYLLNKYGVFFAAMAGSHSSSGSGGLVSLGFDRQTVRLNYGIQATASTQDFRQVGLVSHQLSPSLLTKAFWGIDLSPYGTFSTSYTVIKGRTSADPLFESLQFPSSKILTLSYGKNIIKNIYLNVGVVSNLSDRKDNQVFAALIFALDSSHSLSVNGNHQDNNSYEAIQLNKNLPLGNGTGYRLYAARNSIDRFEGDYAIQNDIGTYTARVSRVENQNNYQLEASGSVIHFASKTALARNIRDSFAVVKVPNIEHVGVFYRNELMGYTNKHGDLLIPNLLPYQKNDIRIETRDLPLDTTIESDAKKVMPYYRSGILVNFPIQKTRGILFQLIIDSEKYLPAGAIVKVKVANELLEYPVAYEGMVYVDQASNNEINGTAYWGNHSCNFNVNIPPIQSAITNVGIVPCH